MADIALTNAAAYAERHRLRLAERLGFGIHGTVHVAEYESFSVIRCSHGLSAIFSNIAPTMA